tara:strand:+ start:7393 stop:8157 length:765 start_codon:yes stop_codon:yes gene_type:complete
MHKKTIFVEKIHEILNFMNLNENIIKKRINKKPGINLITVDGITCSGKSIFSKLLKKKLSKKFDNIYIIPKDLFLFSRIRRIKIIKKINKKINHKQNELHYDLKKLSLLISTLINQPEKKTLTLSGLYDRKTGKNSQKIKFKFKKNSLIIYEGLYLLDDLKGLIKPNLKILITEKIYDSLARKIERIRDKKISIQHVVFEFTNLHLKSFKNYLVKNSFNCSYSGFKRNFVLIKNGKEIQINLIRQFQKKHLKKY